jgi:WD40 repeat protein
VHNFQGQDSIINTLALNDDGVLFSGGDNGSVTFWDYKSGLPIQTMQDVPQPGSLDAEAGQCIRYRDIAVLSSHAAIVSHRRVLQYIRRHWLEAHHRMR